MRTVFRPVLFIVVVAWLPAGCASQQPIGLIGNDEGKTVAAFDPVAHTVHGAVRVPASGDRDVYALALHPTGREAYVSDRFGRITRLALTLSTPPTTAARIYPSHSASDLAVLDGDPPLLVAIGTDTASTVGVASTISLKDNAEIDRLRFDDARVHSVTVCDDASTVLIGTDAPHAVHKLAVSDRGQLTRTGATLVTQHPVATVHCAPGSQTAIVVSSRGAVIQSFDVGAMTSVATRDLAAQSAEPIEPPLGLSGVFTPSGNRFYVRSERGDFTGVGFVEAFPYDATTGRLGRASRRARVEPTATSSLGTSELALSPDGSRLYVPLPGSDRVRVLDASLSFITTIGGVDIDGPFGIAIGGG
jgi:YVTN family beta-propeller protein